MTSKLSIVAAPSSRRDTSTFNSTVRTASTSRVSSWRMGGGREGGGGGLNATDVLLVSRRLFEKGVKSFCPTMVSLSKMTYVASMNAVRDARERRRDGRMRV
ncbi:hypothetical protein ACHAXA_002607 [Cyclostephanos tholiformis]|uniref:Uncharacterized protein n=1 Tax=Cyclostephanos tholiformis TaxID=382380 RepID=A0ABD3SBG0_9STRA